jgi:hypothetical protein
VRTAIRQDPVAEASASKTPARSRIFLSGLKSSGECDVRPGLARLWAVFTQAC